VTDDDWTARYGATALVTGASSGIGEQFARLLAARGLDLLLSARRVDRLQLLGRELEEVHGISVRCQPCDLSEPADVAALIEAARELQLGLVVSNAGYGVAKGEYMSVPVEELEAMYRANSIAPARIAHALLPGMRERGRGALLFTGSIEGELAFPYSVGYAASKAFLHSLALGLWQELHGSGVDVLLLAPGSTDTEAPIKQGISRDQLVGVMSPGEVAQQALEQLGRRPLFIPGPHNRIFVALLRILPRSLAIRLAGSGMRRAIEQSRPAP
jgi:short-subunit dehydrogenase